MMHMMQINVGWKLFKWYGENHCWRRPKPTVRGRSLFLSLSLSHQISMTVASAHNISFASSSFFVRPCVRTRREFQNIQNLKLFLPGKNFFMATTSLFLKCDVHNKYIGWNLNSSWNGEARRKFRIFFCQIADWRRADLQSGEKGTFLNWLKNRYLNVPHLAPLRSVELSHMQK